MTCKAKFEVIRVTEFGYGGSRTEISRTTLRVPANTPHPVDGSVTFYDRNETESTGIPVREITMSAVYGASGEDQHFATATPTGTITFSLNNPDLADMFKPGEAYYVQFTKA